MPISNAFDLATNAEFKELSNFATPPRAGKVTAIEASGQIRVESDDPDGGDVLAWPLNGFTYAVDDVVYIAFAANSPDTAIVIGSKAPAPALSSSGIAPTLAAADSKTTPVDGDDVPLIDSEASDSLKRLSWANLKATLKNYLDTLYVALTGTQTIAGAKTFTSAVSVETAGQALNATRLATSTNQLSAVANFKAQLVGTMADGFGTGFFFRGEDSSGVDNTLVLMGGVRDGADNTGRFRLFAYLAGVAHQVLDVTAAGFFGFKVASPQGMLHAHDGTGGFIFVTKTGLNATAQTIIPDGSGDVTKGLTGFFVCDSGGAVMSTFELTPGANVDVSVGGFTLRLALSAAGALTAVRIGGTGTATLAIAAVWM